MEIDWLTGFVCIFVLNVAVNGFGTDRSKAVPLFQFFIGAWVVGVVSYLAFVMSLFVHHSPSSGAWEGYALIVIAAFPGSLHLYYCIKSSVARY